MEELRTPPSNFSGSWFCFLNLLKLFLWLLRLLLDTGADVSVTSSEFWPSTWPISQAFMSLQGIGTSSNPYQSSQLLSWSDNEGHSGSFRPYVLPDIPINLWGRDILQSMNAHLVTSSPALNIMMKQGFHPSKGLGRNLQGDPVPLEVVPKNDRLGLGVFSNGSL